jgi:hypothetical protein
MTIQGKFRNLDELWHKDEYVYGGFTSHFKTVLSLQPDGLIGPR